jgi:predicted ATPase/DNA-binding winged helix-turn-helix (wHTH) protein
MTRALANKNQQYRSIRCLEGRCRLNPHEGGCEPHAKRCHTLYAEPASSNALRPDKPTDNRPDVGKTGFLFDATLTVPGSTTPIHTILPTIGVGRHERQWMPDRDEILLSDDVISFGAFRLRPAERLLQKDSVTVSVGGRALSILIVLVERAGETISSVDLISRVWPDTTVGDGSLRFHVAGLRKSLGDGEAGSRFVTNIPGRGYRFVAPISRSREPRPSMSLPGVKNSSHRLAPRRTRMIGRDDAVRATTEQLLTRRFVTIVGPGGIGKTTIAVAVSDALVAVFEQPVCFVDFSQISDASLVASTLASALGLSVLSSDPVNNIISFLRDRKALIVLDCCEHLIEATAVLAEQLFASTSRVYILATSREPLKVTGESVFRLGPLQTPPDSAAITAAEAARYPAVQLFVERATACLYQFELLDTNAPVIAEICRRLDGIALAIELAAGRVDSFGVGGIARLLDNRFSLSGRGRRMALPRHQTLSATLDWSHGLLLEAERVVLHRLSVFVGTFSLSAAQTIAAADDISVAQAFDAVVNLVAKSLIVADVSGKTARYRLLDTTRAYARQKLLDSDAASLCARRHAEYYVDIFLRVEAQAEAGSTSEYLADHAQDIGNLRAALEWALSSNGDAPLGYALAAVATPIFLELSLLNECRAWGEKAMALPGAFDRNPRHEMLLRTTLGISILNTIGNTDEAHQALIRALEVAEQIDAYYYQLNILEALNLFHQRIPDLRGAQELAVRGEAVIGILADRTGRTHTDWMTPLSQQYAGNHMIAFRNCELAVRNAPIGRPVRRFGIDRRNNSMIQLVRALWILGYRDQATAAARNVLAEVQNLNHGVAACIALHWMTCVSFWNRDLDQAETLIAMLFDCAEKSSLSPFHGLALGWEGALALHRGNAEDAVRLLGTSLQRLEAIGHRLMTTAFLSVLAEALAAAGHREKGLITIDKSIGRIEQTGEFIYLPEVLRKKGEILASGPAADQLLAEGFLLRSLECAHGQEALSWELRTATSLARLRQRLGRSEEARTVLAPVYGRFSEGFDTSDLRVAKRLLDELS